MGLPSSTPEIWKKDPNMLLFLAIVLAAALLAYANGANDNFKGVVTLFDSASSGYRKALHWACWNTLAGSVAAIWLAHRLTHAFSRKGLVPDSVVAAPTFLASSSLGAAATVLLATHLGLPISTTHALTGGLWGAGLVHAGGSLSAQRRFLRTVADQPTSSRVPGDSPLPYLSNHSIGSERE